MHYLSYFIAVHYVFYAYSTLNIIFYIPAVRLQKLALWIFVWEWNCRLFRQTRNTILFPNRTRCPSINFLPWCSLWKLFDMSIIGQDCPVRNNEKLTHNNEKPTRFNEKLTHNCEKLTCNNENQLIITVKGTRKTKLQTRNNKKQTL